MIALLSLLMAVATPEEGAARPATAPRIIGGNISALDYPPSALRNEAQGRTYAQLAISAGGRATRCLVTRSSGHQILDRRTCDIALTRMRFSPALDAAGQPMAVTVILPVVWSIDEPPPPAPQPIR